MNDFTDMREFEAGICCIKDLPCMQGTLDMIVRHPKENEREVLTEAELSFDMGLKGDYWLQNAQKKAPGKPLIKNSQPAIMNSRVIALIEKDRSHWPLAGDQLFIDINMSGNQPSTRDTA